MNRNGYTTSWRAKERIETLDLPLAEDHDHPVWVKRPKDAFERELEPITPEEEYEHEQAEVERIERFRDF